MCNLGICLMKQGMLGEPKGTLRLVKPAAVDGPREVDSHLKAYERAQQMLQVLESEMMNNGDKKLFDAFMSSSALWQPQPCKEHFSNPRETADGYGNEKESSLNIVVVNGTGNSVAKRSRRSGSPGGWTEFLPDSKDFEETIIAAVLGSSTGPEKMNLVERKIEKRLKVFQDITPSIISHPRA